MANTNMQQWNPTAANQETDAQYTADSSRSGGASTGSIFPSATANKLFYQLSTYVTALMQALVAKGYTTSDASLSTLAGVLACIMTNADMAPYALQTWVESYVAGLGYDTVSDVNSKISTAESTVEAWVSSGGAFYWNGSVGCLVLPPSITNGTTVLINFGVSSAGGVSFYESFPNGITGGGLLNTGGSANAQSITNSGFTLVGQRSYFMFIGY